MTDQITRENADPGVISEVLEKNPELNDPESIKRSAVEKLTDLTNKL